MRKWIVSTLSCATLIACGPLGQPETTEPETSSETDPESPPGEEVGTAEQALEAPYGGYSESPEEPDFGDAETANAPELNEDEPVEDPVIEDDPATDDIESDPDTRQLMVSLHWGQSGANASGTVDWDGTIIATNAAVRVVRRMDLEFGVDRLKLRTNIREVPFVSSTENDTDGLLLRVYLHPNLETDPSIAPSIRFESSVGTHEIVLDTDTASGTTALDEDGNTLTHHVFAPDSGNCSVGMVFTYYADPGVYASWEKGKILAYDGSLIGKISGVYGQRYSGAKVFYWKVIDPQGDFMGLVAGRYDGGIYAGRYLAEGKVIQGGVVGAYRNSIHFGGVGVGRWSSGCNELSTEGTVDSGDEANDVVEDEIAIEEGL